MALQKIPGGQMFRLKDLLINTKKGPAEGRDAAGALWMLQADNVPSPLSTAGTLLPVLKEQEAKH